MRRLRCPQCGTVVSAEEGVVPVCPGCGFGAPPAPPAVAAAQAQEGWPSPDVPPEEYGGVVFGEQAAQAEPEPLPAWEPSAQSPEEAPAEAWPQEAWPQPEEAPEQAPPAQEGGSAPGEPFGRGPPGKRRSPAVVVLLTLVTLGVYGLVWTWRTATEVDRHRGTWWASPMVRPAVVLVVVSLFLAVVAAVVALYLVDLGQPEGVADTTSEADAARTGALVLYGLAALLNLLALVLYLVGSWRMWKLIQTLETERGVHKPISPGGMLALCLLSLLTAGITMYVMMALVQSRLNRVWQRSAEAASGAAGAPEAS